MRSLTHAVVATPTPAAVARSRPALVTRTDVVAAPLIIAAPITDSPIAAPAATPAAVAARPGHQLSRFSIHSTLPVGVQAKLTVSQPDDKYEQEADRVADTVMRMSEPTAVGRPQDDEDKPKNNIQAKSISGGITPLVYRRSNLGDVGGHEVASDFTRHLGGGAPLDTVTRNYFEPRFGHDFSHVRIHDGPQAATAAASVQARAFTLGRDVVFAAGEYDTHSERGKRLLAHELTHVVQQSHDLQQPTKFSEQRQDGSDIRHEQCTQFTCSSKQHRRIVILRQTNSELVQCDLLDAVQILGARDPALTNWVFELGTAYEFLRGQAGSLTDIGRRRVAAVEAAFNASERQNYSEASLINWMQAIVATLGSLTARSPWTSIEQHERILEASRAVMSAATPRIPSLRSAADASLAEIEQEREQRNERRLTQQLTRYIRRHWTAIRTAPSIQWVAIEQLMRRTLRTDEEFNEYVTGLADINRRLYQFIELIQRNPRAIADNTNDVFRALVLAVGGEWADLVGQTDDQVLAGELTGDTEASVEAEVTGTAIDTAITMLPIADQIGDIRDFSAHIYALLNISGRHQDEISSPMRWLGVVLSGIGAVPELGSFLKGTGRIIVRLVQRIGDGVSGIVSRSIAPVVGLFRRHTDAIPWFQRLLSRVSGGWESIASTVRRQWVVIAESVSSRLNNILLRATEYGTRMRGRWLWVRSLADDMITAALTRLQRFFAPVYEGVISALQRGGRAVVGVISPRLINLGSNTLRRTNAVLQSARHHLSNLRDRFSTPTERMLGLDRSMDELAEVQTRLQLVMDIGDAPGIEALTRQANRLAADIERRMGRSAGAHISDTEELVDTVIPPRVLDEEISPVIHDSSALDSVESSVRSPPESATEIPTRSTPSSDVPTEDVTTGTRRTEALAETTKDTTTDVASATRRADAAEPAPTHRVSAEVLGEEQGRLRELARQPDAVHAVEDSDLIRRGYEAEVDIGDGVTYRRRRDGIWCRFNSPADCDVPVPAELEVAAHSPHSDLVIPPEPETGHGTAGDVSTPVGENLETHVLDASLFSTADEYLMALRNERHSGANGLGESWDYVRFPRGPRRRWAPGDPINMPDSSGIYPTFGTARGRLWRNRAHFELQARAESEATRIVTSSDPIRAMTDLELSTLQGTTTSSVRSPIDVTTGRAMEIEHFGLPQRVGRWMEDAGFTASEARRLSGVADPEHLLEVSPLEHAFFDSEAHSFGSSRSDADGLVWDLTQSSDPRTARPLYFMTDDTLRAIVMRASTSPDINLHNTPSLRNALQNEITERSLALILP